MALTKVTNDMLVNPGRKGFSVYCTTGQALTNSAYTALICDSETFDTHGLHNTTTGEIIADSTCTMSFKIGLLTSSHTPSGAWSFGLRIRKNGSDVKDHVDTTSVSATTSYPMNYCADVPCVLGDVITIQVYRSSTTSFSIFSTASSAYTFIDCTVT